MKDNVIVDKSFEFALKVVELYKMLLVDKKEFVLSKQLLRSGTSIGANVREANVSQSKKEFIAKMNISLKEAHETDYWLALLCRSGFITQSQALKAEIDELIRILTSIVKTANESKPNLNR